MSEKETLLVLEKHWASTCQLIFGGEVGKLEDFVALMSRDIALPTYRKSSLSGKEVAAAQAIPAGARVAAYEELLVQSKSNARLSINDIKDMDSLVRAMGEDAVYAGNIMQGECSGAYLSNRVLSSHFIYRSHDVIHSKYVAYSHALKYCESCFFNDSMAKDRFSARCFDIYESNSMFECVRVYTSARCYFCADMDDCSDCLFSFNLRSKRRCIGNLALPLEKFSGLKEKLVGEMREALGARKGTPSILDIIGAGHA